MTDKNKNILLCAVSVLILVATWFLVVSPMNNKTATIKAETETLKATYSDLMDKEQNRGKYLQDTEQAKADYDAILAKFPSSLGQEYSVELIQNVRENMAYDVTSAAYTEPTLFYTLGGTATVDATVDENGNPVETAPASSLVCNASEITTKYAGDYEGLKQFVAFINNYKYRMTLDNVSITYVVDTQSFVGDVTMIAYDVEGAGREDNLPDIDVDGIKVGVSNLFASGSSATTTSKYDEDNAEAIIKDYDVYLALNPTTSDTSGKVIGMKTSSANDITSNENKNEIVSLTISKENDKYYAEYAIGLNKKKVAFDPGEDMNFLIQSIDTKDAEDKNGAKISIENNTDITLNVKIAGDENASRVKIVNKTGSVRVYQ